MGIGRNGKWRWVLAAVAITGLAGGGLVASAQEAGAGGAADSAQPADSNQSSDQAPGQPAPREGFGRGFGGPRGPGGGTPGFGEGRPMGPPGFGPGAGRGFGAMRRERAGLSLDRPLLMSLRSLDLTDPQWQRVQAILEVQQLRGDSANESPQQRQAQMAALLNPGDPQHTAALQAIKQRADARIDQAARTQQALYDVLTPAQKTRFQQLVAQRRERMDQRMQQRGARRDQDNGPGDAPAPSGP